MAERYSVSEAALVLAWVCQQPGISAAVAGASTPGQVSEQLAAIELTLAAEDVDGLSREFAKVPLVYQWEAGGLVGRARRFAGRLFRRATGFWSRG